MGYTHHGVKLCLNVGASKNRLKAQISILRLSTISINVRRCQQFELKATTAAFQKYALGNPP